MTEMPGPGAFAGAVPLAMAAMGGPGGGATPIGCVLAVAGGSSRVLFDRNALDLVAQDADPVIASAGQVGGQIKMRVGGSWLVANVRSLTLQDNGGDWPASSTTSGAASPGIRSPAATSFRWRRST